MSALFDQFLIEARDLLEAATASLLRLEGNPADREAVNDLFRAFHTLKGATGLFDLEPFTRLVHAGEDVLVAMRDGDAAVTPALADDLFRAIDQSGRWLDRLESTQGLPDDAASVAQALAAELRAALQNDERATAAPVTWIDGQAIEALRAHGSTDTGPFTAVTYHPDPECFFNGDDPLDLCRRIPDLCLLRVEPVEPWPVAAELDPYRCNLRFLALSRAPVDAVRAVFRTAPDRVVLSSVTIPRSVSQPETRPTPDPVSSSADPLADAMLREQARILSLPGSAEERQARRGSVIRAVGNILAALGRSDERASLSDAAADDARLSAFIDRLTTPAASAEPVPASAPAPQARRALRVDPDRMDRLMALVAELGVAKASLPGLAGRSADEGLAQDIRTAADRIDGLVGELQHAVLRLRLLPLSRVMEPMSRLVRDTARRLGKPVELTLSGGETEADKDILDILGEPLLHLVRNALDHGIEPPERRAAQGKPATGSIRVAAAQERDGVAVEVADDGAGIDPAQVLAKALEKGIVDPDRAGAMGEREILSLIFAPGFSTSATVSDLSGRGVGMDAVRSAVEQAGGRVEVDSTVGRGTTVRVRLPLTVSITRVLVVEAAGELFGIPVGLVGGMVRLPKAEIRAVKHAESIVGRDGVVPLYRLRRLLGLGEDARPREAEAVLLLDLGGPAAAVVVDGFRARADVVLRPMTGLLRGLRGYSGTAVLGDGRILPVLNLRELL